MRNDLPQSRRVLQRVVHGPRSVSLTIDYTCDFAPGQFVMAWLPGVDEKPFSVSRHQPDTIEITVDSVLIDPMLVIDFLGAADEEVVEDDDSGGGFSGSTQRSFTGRPTAVASSSWSPMRGEALWVGTI